MTRPIGPDINGVPVANAAPIDVVAILAAMQDQIDDLTATVEAHQRRLDELSAARPPAAAGN